MKLQVQSIKPLASILISVPLADFRIKIRIMSKIRINTDFSVHLATLLVIRLAFCGARYQSGFRTRVKGDDWRERFIRVNVYEHVNVCTHVKTINLHRDGGIRMFVQVARQGTSTNV